VVQSAPPPIHHDHLQWYSIDLSLYLMCLHSLLKLHLQYSSLTIIIAPQMRHKLSQPGQSQLVTRPSSARKHLKNRFTICQIFLSFPHSTLYNQLSLLTKAWNRLHISFSELDAITPIQIFNFFLTNSIMRQLVAKTNSYAQQQLLGPEKKPQRSWQPVTAQDLYLWLPIQIHMGLIGVPPERYWMKMEFTFPRIEYHQLPTLARLAFRRSTASFMFVNTIHQLKLLKTYLVGI